LERHFTDLCNQLADRHDVIAIAHPDFKSKLSSQVRLEPLDLSAWRYQPAALFKLYRALRKHRPQVVHAQANKAAAMVGALRPVLRIKTVATIHNFKRSTRMYRSFDRVIAVSHHTAKQLGHPRTDVIYNGIEPPVHVVRTGLAYLQEALGREFAQPAVLAVGRLVAAKGFELLLRTWVDVPGFLVIVGDGPERARIEALLRELGLSDRVLLAGYRDDIVALLANADMMVISSFKEGFSYVLAEGLHVRQIAVATRVPVAMEILPEDFLVDYGDPQALAETIKRALRDPEATRRAFEPVWEFAARELTLKRMVEKTEQVYQKLLSVQ
jgi:glycosyltransferase involved in cell wall biosynthesis